LRTEEVAACKGVEFVRSHEIEALRQESECVVSVIWVEEELR